MKEPDTQFGLGDRVIFDSPGRLIELIVVQRNECGEVSYVCMEVRPPATRANPLEPQKYIVRPRHLRLLSRANYSVPDDYVYGGGMFRSSDD